MNNPYGNLPYPYNGGANGDPSAIPAIPSIPNAIPTIRDQLNKLMGVTPAQAPADGLSDEERKLLKAARQRRQGGGMLPPKSIPRDSMVGMQPMVAIDDGYR